MRLHRDFFTLCISGHFNIRGLADLGETKAHFSEWSPLSRPTSIHTEYPRTRSQTAIENHHAPESSKIIQTNLAVSLGGLPCPLFSLWSLRLLTHPGAPPGGPACSDMPPVFQHLCVQTSSFMSIIFMFACLTVPSKNKSRMHVQTKEKASQKRWYLCQHPNTEREIALKEKKQECPARQILTRQYPENGQEVPWPETSRETRSESGHGVEDESLGRCVTSMEDG